MNVHRSPLLSCFAQSECRVRSVSRSLLRGRLAAVSVVPQGGGALRVVGQIEPNGATDRRTARATASGSPGPSTHACLPTKRNLSTNFRYRMNEFTEQRSLSRPMDSGCGAGFGGRPCPHGARIGGPRSLGGSPASTARGAWAGLLIQTPLGGDFGAGRPCANHSRCASRSHESHDGSRFRVGRNAMRTEVPNARSVNSLPSRMALDRLHAHWISRFVCHCFRGAPVKAGALWA